MKKKLIALTLIFAMLVPLTPAVAADDTSARPTVEEILSQYHQAAFEAETAGETETAAAYSARSGSNEPTLEQQTVETLNEAGYEAYNVTADNYDALEQQLHTDFADMGLDPEGSYIIVIHGEEDPNDGIAPAADLILPPHEWDPDTPAGGDNTFVHTYNGTNYTMRYITVTAADNSPTKRDFTVAVNQSNNSLNWGVAFDAVLSYAIDSMPGFEDFTTLYTFLSDFTADNSISVVECDEFIVTGCTAWTQQYIQVYKSSTAEWLSSQCSEYAVSRLDSTVYHYDPETEIVTKIDKYLGQNKIYSDFYNSSSTRKDQAAQAFIYGTCTLDYTWDISYKVYHPSSGNNFFINGTDDGVIKNGYVFTQDHWSFHA